ncbi:MAG TPA: post-COAP-1 domain-containing protein, partial [Desulfuromonadaceae bacterium]|nr:post-COAP-1 domain-containing protein [Desulfuromonadaceae bacterium]
DGAADVAVASAQAGITRVQPPLCDGEDAVSGAGWIADTAASSKGKFSLKAGLKAGVLSGHLDYKDDAIGMSVEATSITSYQPGSTSRSRHFEGAAEIDGTGGFSYAVDVVAGGGAGDPDSFSIRLSNGYQAGGFLQGGRIQLHSLCPE